MKLFKAFICGMLLPSVVMPLILFYFSINDPIVLQKLPSLYFGGIAWGLWNILFVITKKYVGINDRNIKIGVYGAVYGLFTVLINSFYFEFTSVLASISDSFIIWFFIIYPVLLYFVWKYIVNALNLIFEVY